MCIAGVPPGRHAGRGQFPLESRPIPTVWPGQILCQNLFISLDAGFRNWMDEDSGGDVLPAMPLGEPVTGLGSVAANLLNALGVGFSRSVTGYFSALHLLLLVLAGLYFFRLSVLSGPQPDDGGQAG